jgi:hypothetical protein
MAKHLHGSNVGQPQILNVERDGDDGLLVAFADGTIGAYVAEELLELRPSAKKSEARNPGQKPATLR